MLVVDYHVIQVYCDIRLVRPQQDVHHALERGRRPVQPEGKGLVLSVSAGGAEGRLGFGSFREGHLPLPFCEVKCGDVPGRTEAIQELIQHLLDFLLSSPPTSFWDSIGPLPYHGSWWRVDLVMEDLGPSGVQREHIRELTNQVLQLGFLNRRQL